MIVQSIALTALVTMLVACGTERPNPDDYIRQGTTDTATGTGKKTTDTTKKTADAAKTDTNSVTTPPPAEEKKPDAAPPAATPPAKLPLRVAPNAAELAAAQQQYDTSCVACHKLGNVLPQAIQLKGKAITKAMIITNKTRPAHNAIQAAYPIDTTSDDGVENEKLAAAAMESILK